MLDKSTSGVESKDVAAQPQPSSSTMATKPFSANELNNNNYSEHVANATAARTGNGNVDDNISQTMAPICRHQHHHRCCLVGDGNGGNGFNGPGINSMSNDGNRIAVNIPIDSLEFCTMGHVDVSYTCLNEMLNMSRFLLFIFLFLFTNKYLCVRHVSAHCIPFLTFCSLTLRFFMYEHMDELACCFVFGICVQCDCNDCIRSFGYFHRTVGVCGFAFVVI